MTAPLFSETPPSTPTDQDAPRAAIGAIPRPSRINPWRLFYGAMVPNWLLCRTEVSQGAKLCYARLAQYGGEDGHCFPKQDTLAVELGISTRQARGYLAELAQFSLIESEQHGLCRANNYYFLDHPWIREGQPASGQDRQSSSGQDRQHTSAPYGKENQKEESQSKREYPHSPPKGDCAKAKDSCTSTQAEEIYAAYPKKVAKPAALRAIRQALKTHPAAFLLERAKLYAVTYNGELQYMPNPATWFNQEQFNDDPVTWRRTVGANGKAPPAIIRADPSRCGVSKL